MFGLFKRHHEEKKKVEEMKDYVLNYQYQTIIKPLIDENADRFISKHEFSYRNYEDLLNYQTLFFNIGNICPFDSTMEQSKVETITEASKLSQKIEWENTLLEARNQLTTWLSRNAQDEQKNWNEITLHYKNKIVNHLKDYLINKFPEDQNKDLRDSIYWIVLVALMENHYIQLGHKCYFNLELLNIIVAGNIPCGWKGNLKDGRLFVL